MIDYPEQQCRTINGAYYAGVLRPLYQENRNKEALKLTRCVLLLQDNTPAHTSQVAMATAIECGFEILLHPTFSPEKAPFDFYLFPKMKFHLRSTLYGSNKGVIGAVNEYLGDQEKAFYFEGMRKLEQRWATCIALKGDYI